MKRHIIPRLLVSLMGVLLMASPVVSERLPLKIYTSADGLGSSFVDFLMRDSRGFMWFCTRDGLSRFDGARFVTYRVGDKNSPPGIVTISETTDGSYWIGTTGGYYRFKAEALSRPDRESGLLQFLNAEYIDEGQGWTFQDREGNNWYIGQDLYREFDRNGKAEYERKSLNLPQNPNLPSVIFQGRPGADGSFWLNTNQGLVRRLPDGRITMLQHLSDVGLALATLTVEKTGRVWVAWGSDIFVLVPTAISDLPPFERLLTQPLEADVTLPIEPERKTSLPERPGEIARLTKRSLGALNIRVNTTSDGHVWITSDNELLEFDGQAFHSYGAEQGLPGGMAEIGEDAAGNLWIGGRTLMRLNRKGLVSYNEADGFKSSAMFAINEGSDGSLYVANGDFYLSRFDGKHFQSTRPNLQPENRFLWSSRYAVLSSANEWWILTDGGLYRFAAGNLQTPLAVYDRKHGLAANEAFQIFEDSRGDIWLSQQPSRAEDRALYRLRRGEEKFYRFTAAEGLPAGKAASSFAEDRNGNLWFGFYEGGLTRFANGRFTEFTTKDGLPVSLISDLLIDHLGRLWITSAVGGVSRVDDPSAPTPAFIPFTTDQGLSSNNVRTITEDRGGNIYVGSVRGVDQISPDLTHVKHYSINDGLAGDFVVDSHCDKDGNLWFATTNGLSRLSPRAGEKDPPPNILLGGLRIAGEKQAISELGDAEISRGRLSHTQNNFQIDFFGLDLHAGETLRYQFMLEGADKAWSAPTDQRTVTYANLRPGSYRFLVRAINSDGITSLRPAILSFTILSPIWLRWWFLALAILVVITLLYLFYRYRLANLHQVNTALFEAKTAEEKLGRAREDRLVELQKVRTRIATDLHDDIGSSLTQIAILSEVAQQSIKGNGASLTPLKSITTVSNELVDAMSDIVWAINPEKDHLQDLVQRMRRFASDVLLARGISLDFEAPRYAADIALGANPRRAVFLIFKESLANIVKHADAKQVRVQFGFSTQKLTLTISDDGCGFDLDKLSSGLFTDQKGGHGIVSMRKRAAEMNGQLRLASQPGQGTTMTVELFLTQALAATQTGGDNSLEIA